MQKKGTLYVVSTPIGNLEDITLRALKILKDVHLIAAEDTRRTKKLLNAYDISVPLSSLYDQNELKKSAFIISRLNEGMDVAYVSDAGTPGISDPGYILINQAITGEIPIVPIPGPSAVITALSVSGLPMESFVFYGFLPSRTGKRKQLLEALAEETKTMVFFESPRRLMSTLKEIKKILGNRNAVISRELTKVYEEILRGTIGEFIDELAERKIKGEITLIVSGSQRPDPISSETIINRLNELQGNSNLSTRDMVDIISKELRISRKEVYKNAIQYLQDRDR